MNCNDYQSQADLLARYDKVKKAKIPLWLFLAIGIAGEAGEILEKLKKHIRKHGASPIPPDLKEQLKAEMGDVLWYLAELASALDLSLTEVAKTNIKKLNSRKKRGVLMGEGDNR